jgi:hypothetical protein
MSSNRLPAVVGEPAREVPAPTFNIVIWYEIVTF